MIAWLPYLAAALLLHPVLVAAGELRVVAVGTGGESVEWTLDGQPVASTLDGKAARIHVAAGQHELWAESPARGSWRVLARPDGASPTGATAVQAWTAVHAAEPAPRSGGWLIPAGAALGSAALLVRPSRLRQTNAALRSLLQRGRRRRGT